MPGSPQEVKFHCTYWQMLHAFQDSPVKEALGSDEERAMVTVALQRFQSNSAVYDTRLIQRFLSLKDFSK